MGLSLSGKVAVVTGASQGIGLAIITELSRNGAVVVCVDKDFIDNREGTADDAAFYQLDLYRTKDFQPMVENLWATHGKIDIWVNCAGIYPSKPAISINEDEWDMVLDLNLKAPFLLSTIVAKRMIESGVQGSIVNIASTAGKIARPGVAHYCASKAGLLMLTRVLALEFAPYQVRVNSVCPGLVETDNVITSLKTPDMQEEHRQKIAKTPMMRAADPREIARAVLYFADEDTSGYTTGQALYVDGGYTAGQTYTTFQEQMEEYLQR